jgi:hypothetical protein
MEPSLTHLFNLKDPDYATSSEYYSPIVQLATTLATFNNYWSTAEVASLRSVTSVTSDNLLGQN